MAVLSPSRRRTSRSAKAAADKGYFRTSDGVDLYFEDSGELGQGASASLPLLYVYGLGCSMKHWKYPHAYFNGAAHRRRQLWMDFRGHGLSAAPRRGQRLTLDLIVQDLAELMQARGVTSCVVMGQSMGGSVALALAHAHPDLVAGMVLLASPARDPANFLPVQPISKGLWRSLIALNRLAPALLRKGYAWGESWRQKLVVKLAMREIVRHSGFNAGLALSDDIDEYIAKVFELSPTYFYDLAESLSRFDVGRLRPQISCPALVLAGGNDQVVPVTEMQYLAGHLPKAKLEVIAHGSHCPHFDDPVTVNRTIAAFLDEWSF